MSNQNYSPWPKEQPKEQKQKGGLFGGGDKMKTRDYLAIALSSFADSIGAHTTGIKGQSLNGLMKRFQDQREQAAQQEEEQRARQAAMGAGYTPQQTDALLAGIPLPKEREPDAWERILTDARIDKNSPEGQDLSRKRALSMARDPGDEFIIVPLPGGTYAGPRSGLPQAMGANNSEPPERLPSDFFGQGGATGNRGGSFPRR